MSVRPEKRAYDVFATLRGQSEITPEVPGIIDNDLGKDDLHVDEVNFIGALGAESNVVSSN